MIVFNCGCTTYEDIPVTETCSCGGWQIARIRRKIPVRSVKGRVVNTLASILDVMRSSKDRLFVFDGEPVFYVLHRAQKNQADFTCPYMWAAKKFNHRLIIRTCFETMPFTYYQAIIQDLDVRVSLRKDLSAILYVNYPQQKGNFRTVINSLTEPVAYIGEIPAGAILPKGSERITEKEYQYEKRIER